MKNISISMKVLIIALIPTAIALFFGVKKIYAQKSIKEEVTSISKLMHLATKFSSLIHELQAERGMSAGYISSKGSKFADTLPDKRAATDGKLSKLTSYYEANKDSLDNKFTSKVNNALAKLSTLASVRDKVTDSPKNGGYTVKEAVAYYSDINQTFLAVIPEITKLSTNAAISRNLTSFNAFIKGKRVCWPGKSWS